MVKNIVYIMIAFMSILFTGCSTASEDAEGVKGLNVASFYIYDSRFSFPVSVGILKDSGFVLDYNSLGISESDTIEPGMEYSESIPLLNKEGVSIGTRVNIANLGDSTATVDNANISCIRFSCPDVFLLDGKVGIGSSLSDFKNVYGEPLSETKIGDVDVYVFEDAFKNSIKVEIADDTCIVVEFRL